MSGFVSADWTCHGRVRPARELASVDLLPDPGAVGHGTIPAAELLPTYVHSAVRSAPVST